MSDIACAVCHTQFSRYTCPRCGIRYCSMACYQRHGDQQCQRLFLQQQIKEQVQNISDDASGVTEGDRRKAMEMLRRAAMSVQGDQAEEEVEEEEEEVMGNRGDGNGGGDREWRKAWEAMWQRVVEVEAQERGSGGEREDRIVELMLQELESDRTLRLAFERSVREGKMSRWAMRELWSPWWTRERQSDGEEGGGTALVQEVEENEEKEETSGYDDGNGAASTLPPLARLLGRREPAITLPFDVLDVLYSYCYTVRFFNGEAIELLNDGEVMKTLLARDGQGNMENVLQEEMQSQFVDTASSLYRLSQYVFGNAGSIEKRDPMTHENTASVVQNAIEKSSYHHDLFDSWNFSLSVLGDVMCLMEDAKLVQRALHDTQKIFDTASNILNSQAGRSHKQESLQRRENLKWSKIFGQVSRKVYFYRAWCNAQERDFFATFRESWQALAQERREMITQPGDIGSDGLSILNTRTKREAPRNVDIATGFDNGSNNKTSRNRSRIIELDRTGSTSKR